jgi:hypothetical protein
LVQDVLGSSERRKQLMGLDMYLYRRSYVGANFEHNKVEGNIDIKKKGKQIPIDIKKVAYIYEEVAYWRKANQIHSFFVDNFANGQDNCQPIYVDTEGLQKLLTMVRKVIAVKDAEYSMEMLPTAEGFFFGSTNIDEYYYEQLEETEEILKHILDNHLPQHDYIYEASW